mgnify:CR=1 FL=1
MLMMGYACVDKNRKQPPVAKDGVIDLSQWDFNRDGPVELRGEWRFAWQEFVEPMPIGELRDRYQDQIQVPAVWTSQPNNLKLGDNLPPTGFGTYMLEVKVAPNSLSGKLPFAIKLNNVWSAAEIEILDKEGKTILGQTNLGFPSEKAETEVPFLVTNIGKVARADDHTLMVFMRISNYLDIRGGTYWAPQWGTHQSLKLEWVSSFVRSLFLIGALMIIGLYHLVLYAQRQEDKVSLAFCFFCAAMALYETIMCNLFQHLGWGQSSQGFQIIQTIDYLNVPLMIISATIFILRMFPSRLYNLVYLLILAVGVSLSVFTLLMPTLTFSKYLILYETYIIAAGLIAIVHVGIQAFYKNRKAQWMLVSLCLIVLGAINDILHGNGVIETGYYATYTFLGFVMLQSSLISSMAAQAYRQAKYLSENLKEEVKQQTIALEQKTEIAVAAKQESDQAHQRALAAKQESDQAHTTAINAKRESDQAREEAEKLRRKAENQAEKLKELDMAKTTFFQNVSHELRTPLTLILNPLEHLTRKIPNDKDARVAAKNSKRLLRLVNQLLDFQKLEAGKKELKLSPVNLRQFINVCADYFSAACTYKKINFQVTMNGEKLDSSSQPIWVMGEIDSLEKITFNFLVNALNYTPHEGSIELGLDRIENQIKIRVTDSGPGISAEDQTKLFEVFSQVDGSTTRTHEGSGLGLALAKYLAQEMDGDVGVDSDTGKGSTFWASFSELIEAKPPVRVLIVEKDQLLLQNLMDEIAEQLKLTPDEIYGTNTAEQAMEYLSKKSAGCVITDYDLPDQNGLDLMSEISKNFPEAYRVLITADIDFGLVERGINDHLVHQLFHKTNDNDQLINNLVNIVRANTSDHNQMLTQNTPVIDLLIVDDDPRILDTLTALFFDQLPAGKDHMKVTDNAHDAVNIMKNHAVRCVVSDYQIGADDGLTLLEDISKKYPETKKILITGQADIDIMQRAVNAGAVDQVFYKPMDHNDFVHAVQEFINQSHIVKKQTTTDFAVKPWLIPESAVHSQNGDPESTEPSTEDTDTDYNNNALVLVVDDLDDMRDLIKTDLKARHYRVITAKNGEEALDMARQYLPDLIITDWMMPVMDGPTLITKINEDSELNATPTILLTAKSDEDSRMLGTETGADGFLGKPFNDKELTSLVKNLLSLKAREHEVKALNTMLTENVLKRYLPPDLVDQIISGETNFDDQAKTVTATILFSDLVGFTELSSEIRVSKTSKILNSYLETMNEIIFQHGGTVDKFIGDSIMVIFGAPTEYSAKEQANKAAACALAMQAAMDQLNQQWMQDNMPALEMRIGIHQGPVMVGNFGSKRRSDYTAIGPTVNKASRIEGSCEPGHVLISAEMYDFLDEAMAEKIGVFNLKGIKGSHNLYKLVG